MDTSENQQNGNKLFWRTALFGGLAVEGMLIAVFALSYAEAVTKLSLSEMARNFAGINVFIIGIFLATCVDWELGARARHRIKKVCYSAFSLSSMLMMTIVIDKYFGGTTFPYAFEISTTIMGIAFFCHLYLITNIEPGPQNPIGGDNATSQ